MQLSILILCTFMCMCTYTAGFSSVGRSSVYRKHLSVFMGRAAAVRAKTKERTDGAKAKKNNIYAKKIIMVKTRNQISLIMSLVYAYSYSPFYSV